MATKSKLSASEKAQMEEIKKIMADVKNLNEKYYKEAAEIAVKSNRLINQSYQLTSLRFVPPINLFCRIR